MGDVLSWLCSVYVPGAAWRCGGARMVHHWCTNGLVCAACQGEQLGCAHRFKAVVGTARTSSTDPDGWRAARRRFPGSAEIRRRPGH